MAIVEIRSTIVQYSTICCFGGQMRSLPRTLVLILAGLLVAACAGQGDAEGQLVVYSGRGEELVQPLIDDFSEQTGIEVEVRYGESPELAATLLQEGEGTEADIFYAQDPASLGSVSDMLSALPSEITEQV